MRKLICLMIFIIIQSAVVFSQQDGKGAMIVPGKGIGDITIGMTYEKVVEILGMPLQRRGQEQERQELVKRTLNPKRELRFFIGFDLVAEYSSPTNRTEYPIYTLYFKDNKLVYMVLSSYNYDLEKCKSFGIESALFFGDDKSRIKKVLGKNPLITDTKTDTLLLDYLEKGVSVFLQDNAVRAIYIYAPFNREMMRTYARVSSSNS